MLYALEADHEFLLKGDVFTSDMLETYIAYKRETEVDPMRMRPHPYEFTLVLRRINITAKRNTSEFTLKDKLARVVSPQSRPIRVSPPIPHLPPARSSTTHGSTSNGGASSFGLRGEK